MMRIQASWRRRRRRIPELASHEVIVDEMVEKYLSATGIQALCFQTTKSLRLASLKDECRLKNYRRRAFRDHAILATISNKCAHALVGRLWWPLPLPPEGKIVASKLGLLAVGRGLHLYEPTNNAWQFLMNAHEPVVCAYREGIAMVKNQRVQLYPSMETLEMPRSTTNPVLIAFEGKLYVIGGFVQCYDGTTWSLIPESVPMNHNVVAVVKDRKIFLIPTSASPYQRERPVFVFDVDTLSWASAPAINNMISPLFRPLDLHHNIFLIDANRETSRRYVLDSDDDDDESHHHHHHHHGGASFAHAHRPIGSTLMLHLDRFQWTTLPGLHQPSHLSLAQNLDVVAHGSLTSSWSGTTSPAPWLLPSSQPVVPTPPLIDVVSLQL